MNGALALGEAAISVALLALFLLRMGVGWRLGLDAAAAGVTLAVTLAVGKLALGAHPVSPAAEAWLIAGLPEEALKMLGIAAFLRHHARARNRREIVLAAGALALGFAGFENFSYIARAQADWTTVWERAVASSQHVLLGLAGGYVVALAPSNARGAAMGAAAWLGLGFLHGLYDFAVFAGEPGAATPPAYDFAVAALGLDRSAALWAMALVSLTAQGLAAAGALARTAQRRGLGLALSAFLLAGAGLALIGGGVRAYASLDGNWFFLGASQAVVMSAFGLMSLPPRGPAPVRYRWGVAATAAALAMGAGLISGPAGWRRLQVEHAQAQGARFYRARDFDAALAAYDRALTFAPQDVGARTGRAAAYLLTGRYEQALADIDAGLRAAPSAALFGLRADVDVARRDNAAALADADAAVRLNPAEPDVLARRAQVRLEAGDYRGAREDLDLARSLTPRRAAVLRVYAALSVFTGDLDAAIRDLNQILHDDPQDADAREARGRVWFYKGEFARARDDFAAVAAVQATPFPALWRSMAQARLKPGAPEAPARGESWPAPLARMLRGEMAPEAARALAKDDEQRCEADFFFAASRLGDDASDVSAARLSAVRDECPPNFVQHEAALALLRRLAP